MPRKITYSGNNTQKIAISFVVGIACSFLYSIAAGVGIGGQRWPKKLPFGISPIDGALTEAISQVSIANSSVELASKNYDAGQSLITDINCLQSAEENFLEGVHQLQVGLAVSGLYAAQLYIDPEHLNYNHIVGDGTNISLACGSLFQEISLSAPQVSNETVSLHGAHVLVSYTNNGSTTSELISSPHDWPNFNVSSELITPIIDFMTSAMLQFNRSTLAFIQALPNMQNQADDNFLALNIAQSHLYETEESLIDVRQDYDTSIGLLWFLLPYVIFLGVVPLVTALTTGLRCEQVENDTAQNRDIEMQAIRH